MIKYILKKPYRNGMTCQGSCKNIKKRRNWQRAIFAQCTIFAAMMLNFCVRNGYRCVHHAINLHIKSIYKGYTFKTTYKNYSHLPLSLLWLKPRPISNSQLHTLPYFHLCPIYLVVFKGSYYLSVWEILSLGGLHA